MISVIHNVFRYNPLIAETVKLNLLALEQSQVPYQYIIFNDNGDEMIELDIKHLMNKNTEYVYSPINYGQRKCTGGWRGALPYVKGDIIHNTGQDDVMTSLFYETIYKIFLSNSEFKFISIRGFIVNEDLTFSDFTKQPIWEYNTKEKINTVLHHCLGINSQKNHITDVWNPFYASGTLYKKELHDLIGLPDIDTFGGVSDFEYWLRIFYNGVLGEFVNKPLWYWRISQYTSGNEIIDGQKNFGYWTAIGIERLVEKYSKLMRTN